VNSFHVALTAGLAGLCLPSLATAAPYELEYEVENVFSTIYDQSGFEPLYWPINGTDGLAWDGEGVWASSCDSMLIAKFDPETGEVIDELSYPADAHDFMMDHMAWDGQYLWGNVHSMPGDDEPYMGHLLQIDIETGEEVRRIEVPFRDADSMTPMGTAWDGQYLWTQDPRYGEYYRIDPETEEGTDEPFLSGLRYNFNAISPCGISWDGYSCLWISDLNHGYYFQVEPLTGEVVSYIDPPDNPDPAKYGQYRPPSVTKLFTGMTTDGDRVWIVDEIEGNPLLYQIDVDFPTTGLCAHPVDDGESCEPDGEPFCFDSSFCMGESGAAACVQSCEVEGQECDAGFVCGDTDGNPVCVEDDSELQGGCAGCAASEVPSGTKGAAVLLAGLGLLSGLVRRRRS